MLQSIKFLSNQLWWHNQVSWNSFNAPSILIYIPLVCHCICSNYIYFLYIYKYIYILLYIYIRITIIKLLYTVSIAPVFFFETPLKFDEVITQMIHFFYEIQILMKQITMIIQISWSAMIQWVITDQGGSAWSSSFGSATWLPLPWRMRWFSGIVPWRMSHGDMYKVCLINGA